MPDSIPLQALRPNVLYTSVASTEWSAETLYKTKGNDKVDWGSDWLDSNGQDSESQAEHIGFFRRQWKHFRDRLPTGWRFWDSNGQDSESQVKHIGFFRRQWKRFRDRLPTGWRFGAWVAIAEAGTILLINLAVTIWIAVKNGGESSGVVFQGDCNKASRLTLGIHLVINVLSTLLLAASNYVMQSLCAPTRAEVDRAHGNRFWLDIGLQSVRNLKYTSPWKRALWICLCVSTLPLHLFYNSSFFSAVGASSYAVLLAYGPDIQQIPVNGPYDWKLNSSSPVYDDSNTWDISEWEFLNASACIQAYAAEFVTDRGDIFAITGNATNGTVEPLILVTKTGGNITIERGPFDWICSGMELGVKTCTDVWTSVNSSNWTILGDMPVKYCISQPIEVECQLESNLPLLVVVVIFNAAKVFCMVIVATRMKDRPLVTVGDAIASFIENPDLTTRGMCLVSEKSFLDQPKGRGQHMILLPEPIEYQPRRIRWMDAARPQHWTITILLFISAIAIVLCLLYFAADELAKFYGETGFSALWKFGLGKTHAENVIHWLLPSQGYGALLLNVLIANLPQLILSIIYILFNSLSTRLFLALEWSTYSYSRKPLRVSYPKGDQQSTYFLQIPFCYGLPLLVYSILLHWLVSQSIFLVKVNFWASNSQENKFVSDFTSCGFSPVGMILASIVAGSLMLTALIFGYFRHLNGNMPLAGSCSMAIAAACHSPRGSELKPVKWGVVSGPDEEDMGHISFSSGTVTKPITGHLYA